MTTSPERNMLSPGVLSLLPLFYVGWSDSVLSPTEMTMIHKKVRELHFLSQDEKELLVRWTDPRHPPTKAIFKLWLSEMRRLSASLPVEEKQSLVQIGIEMARAVTPTEEKDKWYSQKTVEAIRQIQEALGITEKGSLRVFLAQMKSGSPVQSPSSDISAKKIQEVLDRTFPDTRQRMRRLMSDPEFQLRHFRDKEKYREQILKWTKLMADQGLGAYAYPIEYGGKGSPGRHITVFEMLGYHDLSLAVKFGVQFGLFGAAIYNLGTQKHHDLYLQGLGNAEILGCFAMTETNHGSNVKGLETTITYDVKTHELDVHTPHELAGKEYIGNALHSDHAVVFGQLIVNGKDHGIHAAVVRVRDHEGQLMSGIRIEDNGYKMGLNGVDNGKLWFHHVRVPAENLLDKYGQIVNGQYKSQIKSDGRRFFTMLGALVAGRVSVAWASVSASKKALAIAVGYALRRRQFESTPGGQETLLLDYPSHQRRLMPRMAKTYALDAAMKRLTKEYVDALPKDDRREVEAMAAGLKAMASWHATDTIQACREACGGKGYLSENQFDDLKNDTDIFTTFEGDNTVLLQLVAKGLLSNMREQFHDEGFVAVLRYLATNLTTRITEMNVYHTRRTDASHLLDPEFYREAFEYRERKLLNTASQRIRNYIGKGVHASEAFLRCQNHIIELAKAHVDWIALKSAYRTYHEIEDKSVQQVFKQLYQLYALSTIEENKGWFLENDYMQPGKTKAIRRMVDKLCSQLRDHADVLIDGFGIPDAMITAPILK